MATDPDTFPRSIMLLVGPPGSGKTAYGLQFLRDGTLSGDDCMYLSCTAALNENVFQSNFKTATRPKFISLFIEKIENNISEYRARNLSDLLKHVSGWLAEARVRVKVTEKPDDREKRFVLDSITDLIARFPEESVKKFIVELYDLLRTNDVAALFAMTAGSDLSRGMTSMLASLLDGVIQLKMVESPINDNGNNDLIPRAFRLFSHKSTRPIAKWNAFGINQHDGSLQFTASENTSAGNSGQTCKLCNGPIISQVSGTADTVPYQYHPHCLDTYRKLSEIYGTHVLYALEPGVVFASFFFIDIVGLSNPLLSVENQIKKIGDLNSIIRSCEAYRKVPKDKKIVLPTGDGMAIGYLMNPELPLLLSIQLHSKLRQFNARQINRDSHLGVRIGLGSGPVFVVTDVNDNQNVWGPGIILARRVMDLGDEGHILLADNIAEGLANLKDEYKKMIKLISSSYVIKHGQLIRLYSAYSEDFGNPTLPTRLASP